MTFFTVLTITFDPQRIFEWSLSHWKVDILGFNLNTNISQFGLILSKLWSFEVGPIGQSDFLGFKTSF